MRHVTLVPALAAVLLVLPARAAPVEDRSAAFEAIGLEAGVERVFSTCRWIRRVRDDAVLDRWRRRNREVSRAARAVIEGQGGLTEPRRKVVDDLAASQTSQFSDTPDGCRAFIADVEAGRHDLTATVSGPTLNRIFTAGRPAGEDVLWVLEQRRQTNGTLAYSARRYDGEGGMSECEDQGARKGHVSFRRHKFDENMMPLPDPEADLWLAECVVSPVDPVTGAKPAPGRGGS